LAKRQRETEKKGIWEGRDSKQKVLQDEAKKKTGRGEGGKNGGGKDDVAQGAKAPHTSSIIPSGPHRCHKAQKRPGSRGKTGRKGEGVRRGKREGNEQTNPKRGIYPDTGARGTHGGDAVRMS